MMGNTLNRIQVKFLSHRVTSHRNHLYFSPDIHRDFAPTSSVLNLTLNLFHSLKLSGLVVTGLILAACSSKSDLAVATVNSDTITLSLFKDRYQDFLNFTHLSDELQFRHLYLQSLIDEYILADYAVAQGIPDELQHKQELQDLEDQLLLNTLYNREIGDQISASEEELREWYRRSKISLHVRHLFARNAPTIASLQARLKQGEVWEDLAREAFKDPVLTSNGGDLGFVKLGDLDPAFEETVYHLQDGETSGPIQTQYGYSIIQVLEREVDPFLTEDEFQMQKGWLDLLLLQAKKRPMIRSYTDRVRTQLGITFEQKGLVALMAQIPYMFQEPDEYPLVSGDRSCLSIRSSNESWTVADAFRELQTLSDQKKDRIRSVKILEDVLAGLAVRKQLLRKATELNLNRSEAFQETLSRAQRDYLIKGVYSWKTGADPAIRPLPAQREWLQSFRDSLRQRAEISLDSALIKQFTLKEVRPS